MLVLMTMALSVSITSCLADQVSLFEDQTRSLEERVVVMGRDERRIVLSSSDVLCVLGLWGVLLLLSSS